MASIAGTHEPLTYPASGLAPEIHAQYLAPFRNRDARVDVLFALARSLHGSAAHFASLWSRRVELAAIPSLLVWGAKDGTFGPTALERWRTALPRARVVALDGAGHWPHEEDPERVARELSAFVTPAGRSTSPQAREVR